MKTVLATCLLLVPLLAVAAAGEDTADAMAARQKHMDKVVNALKSQVLSKCGLSSGSVTYPAVQLDWDSNQVVDETTRFEVTAWSGECASGFRSGSGVIATRETTHAGPRSVEGTVLVKAQGRYLVGKPQGLWCITDHPYLQNGKPAQLTLELGCRLLANGQASAIFHKLADGRWEQIDGSGHATAPPVVLAAGSLESESSRIIAEALAGKADIALRPFNAQSDALDGLIAGMHIRSGGGKQDVSLKGKRVALIVSSRTIAEMDKFTRERQALLDASANVMASPETANSARDAISMQLAAAFGPDLNAVEQRERFMAASATDKLLLRVADALRRVAREVVPVEDLTGLAHGDFDYAFVLDWQSLTRFDLLGKYKAVPTFKDYDSADASLVAGQKLGGFLITPQLEAVRTYSGKPDAGYKLGDCEQSKKIKTNSCDRDYFKALADFYETAWNDPNGFNALNYWFH